MKIDYELFLAKLQANGMESGRAKAFVKRMKMAETMVPFDTAESRKAMYHGFVPDKVDAFGLNDGNYDLFLSDFDYHMMHPLNNHFKIWVNDKLTLKYMLSTSSLGHLMPKYYLYIENDGRYTYLMDMPDDVRRSRSCLLDLLRRERILAMKPNHGEGGAGFIRLEMNEDDLISVNGELISEADFAQVEKKLNGYIVTEYISQCDEFAKIWPSSECSLRVVMAKCPQNDMYAPATFDNIISYARFGASTSGVTSNLSQGGVAVPFDYEDGTLWDRGWTEGASGSVNWNVREHPNTGIAFKGLKIPQFDAVKKCVDDVCSYLSSLDYFGFDLMITNNQVYICEINTLPGFDFEQSMWREILATDPARAFYASKRKAYPEGLLLRIVDECTA